jgi:hypothetical protein
MAHNAQYSRGEGLARPERFELPTNWFEASYSIQLSYGRPVGRECLRTGRG